MSANQPPSDDADTIIRIASRGDGVTGDGRHAPLSAPGDRLLADGSVVAGPHHQTPPCRHFPSCGGCQLQHVDDVAYVGYLHDRVAGALVAQRLAVPPIRTPHLSPPSSRRRATLKALRQGRDVRLGFTATGSHRIVDMRECHLLRPEFAAMLAPLRALLATLLPPRGAGSVQLTMADQGVDLLLAGVVADTLAAHDALMDFAAAYPVARIALDDGDGPEDRLVPEPATITLGGVPVSLPHGAFLQATDDGEAALVAAVLDATAGAARVADLFSGLGTFSFAQPATTTVLAVEAARAAVTAQQGAANQHHRTIRCEHRDLYRRPLIPAELAAFDAVILDPPRAGAEEQVRELAASAVPIIAYVSCNPASFARDAGILQAGGYTIDWVQPVGQFRWSTHMELAARLSRH